MRLDYELELGVWVGQGNAAGTQIPLAQAEAHLFGISLLNDLSARDIQFWEMAPLGPFLRKNFATTISPWIVTMEALAPYRQLWLRPTADPQPLAYLDGAANRASGALDNGAGGDRLNTGGHREHARRFRTLHFRGAGRARRLSGAWSCA